MKTIKHNQLTLPIRKSMSKIAILTAIVIALISTLTGWNLIRVSAAAEPAVLVGAGDISKCDNDYDTKTAQLLGSIPGTVFTTGDNVYSSGTASEFANCYHPTWGKYKDRTMPVPGNHEYQTSRAAGYFSYFGVPKYYAYNRGEWRIYALNSEINTAATSNQAAWLKNDLAANPRKCVMAYWHRPRWSSGNHHGSDPKTHALWEILVNARADLVVAGHEHNYERFARMNKNGQQDRNGVRQIVVGTGGAGHYGFSKIHPASRVRNSNTHGVLKLTLHPDRYEWRFIPIAGQSFSDSGSANCR